MLWIHSSQSPPQLALIGNVLSILIEYREAWLKGLGVTGALLLIPIIAGIPLGTLLGIVGARYSSLINKAIKATNFTFASIPTIVLLFWFHYPLQSLLGVVINPFWTATLTLCLIEIVLTAQIVAQELRLFPLAYVEAGKTLGLSMRQITISIELPIISRRTFPAILSNQAHLLQISLLASLISVPELFRTAQNINAVVYRPVEVYTLLILFFLIILGPLNLLANRLKHQYANYRD